MCQFFGVEVRDFPKYIRHTFENMFNFSGRASSGEYATFLWVVLFYGLLISFFMVWFVPPMYEDSGLVERVFSNWYALSTPYQLSLIMFFMLLNMFALSASGEMAGRAAALYVLKASLMSPGLWLVFFMFLVTLSLTIRRLHDMGYSGGWVPLIYLGIYVAVMLVSHLTELAMWELGMGEHDYALAVLGLVELAFQYGLLYWIFIKNKSPDGGAFGEPSVL